MIGKIRNLLQEFSIPLIAGVFVALVVANIDEHWYHHIVHYAVFGKDAAVFGHTITVHFLVNDVFMVLFFGIAMKEITESILPGGALNPMKKAVNPLLGTLGGVLGPVGVFFILTYAFYGGHQDFSQIANGWGIPTATDIALAWLVARMVFGNLHPAVNFLLLLAVADDAIGLGIIAVFYPDPNNPVQPVFLLITAGGMGLAYAFRRLRVDSWVPYVVIGGGASWVGLIMSHLHPALALVPIIPFLPGPRHDTGIFEDDDERDLGAREAHSPLHEFEHQLKLIVDIGLFAFAFANAGVAFSSINTVTWIVLSSLLIGKTVGITLFSFVGKTLGFPLPTGMDVRHLVVAGIVAGLGLTVALFVAGEAFANAPNYLGPGKMGAVFSASAAVIALIVGKMLNVKVMVEAPGGSSGTEK